MHLQNPKFRVIRKFKKWFNFKFEIIYFYNVYGEKQIKERTYGDSNWNI